METKTSDNYDELQKLLESFADPYEQEDEKDAELLPSNAQQLTVSSPTEADGNKTLEQKLQDNTALALARQKEILSTPIDPEDKAFLKVQSAQIGIVLNTQVRVDENKLRAVRNTTVLEQVLTLFENA